jgi:hypothetical protein
VVDSHSNQAYTVMCSRILFGPSNAFVLATQPSLAPRSLKYLRFYYCSDGIKVYAICCGRTGYCFGFLLHTWLTTDKVRCSTSMHCTADVCVCTSSFCCQRWVVCFTVRTPMELTPRLWRLGLHCVVVLGTTLVRRNFTVCNRKAGSAEITGSLAA